VVDRHGGTLRRGGRASLRGRFGPVRRSLRHVRSQGVGRGGTLGTIVITGSAGGIGRATRALLAADGHQVIGVDVRDAEVEADLSTAGGRRAMVREVEDACGGVLDGLVVAAGLQNDDGPAVVSINYFGA